MAGLLPLQQPSVREMAVSTTRRFYKRLREENLPTAVEKILRAIRMKRVCLERGELEQAKRYDDELRKHFEAFMQES